MATITATYPRRADYWLHHETDVAHSRKEGVLASGEGKVDTGTVLGRILTGAVASAAKAGGNTGAGSLTLDATTPKLSGCKPGVYAVRCIAAVENGGRFQVVDPDGVMLGTVAVGETWAQGVKFAIADSGADFAEGDGFDITVAAGSGEYVVCDLTRVDGGEIADAIQLSWLDATTSARKTVVVAGLAVVTMAQLLFHESFDSLAKKRAAMALLAKKQIQSHALA